MTTTAKLLFDECIGWPAVDGLANLLGSTGTSVELGHAVKMGFGGIRDEEWIPRIAGDGWIIVTGDRGKRPKKGTGQKLHIVCQQHGVTYAALSRAFNNRRVFEKVRILLDVWEGLIDLVNHPRGTGFSIRPSSSGRPIIVCSRPLPPKPGILRQRDLL